MAYWLLKTEPTTFSIDDLAAAANQTTSWEGVRNYQARNFMRLMREGEFAFLYHSSCKEPGIVGMLTIAKGHYPDLTALDESSPYFDPKSSVESPRWYCVDVRLFKKFERIITLKQLRENKRLESMILLRKGNRLSVLPLTEQEWYAICL
jgi:predicted RNA-binding protein with PUA-like domain